MSPELAALPDKIDALGFGTYPDIYGGLVGVNLGEQVDVYLTKLDPAVEDAFRALAPPDTLTFLHTPHSQTYLKAIQQKLIADSSTLQAQGVQIEEFWPDIDTGLEQIGIVNMTAAASANLENSYGASNIHAFNVRPAKELFQKSAVSTTLPRTTEATASTIILRSTEDARPDSASNPTIPV